MKSKFFLTLFILFSMLASFGQAKLVGDGFGGRDWYMPYKYSGSYNAMYTLCSDSNQLYTWGWNTGGQLASKTPGKCGSPTPLLIDGMSHIQQISGAYGLGAVIKDDESLWLWGGKFGSTPTQTDKDVKQVSTMISDRGDKRWLWVKHDGTVWQMGHERLSETVNKTINVPTQIHLMKNAVRVANTATANFALTADGEVYSQGLNTHGERGNNSPKWDYTSQFKKIPGLTDVVDIKTNLWAVIALTSDGDVYSWGMGDYGSIGNGGKTSQYAPVKIASLKDIVAIYADEFQCAAIDKIGNCYIWGNVVKKPNFVYTPLLVASNVADVVHGNNFLMLVKRDSTLWICGYQYIPPPPCDARDAYMWMNLEPNEFDTDSFVQMDPTVSPMNLCIPEPLEIANNFSYLSGGCVHDYVDFRAGNTIDFINFEWDFGDGSTGKGSEIRHLFSDTGLYIVKMSCERIADNQVIEINRTIHVKQAHFIKQLPEDTTFCKNNQFTVAVKNHRTSNTYEWSTGNLTQSITADSAGWYWVKVQDETGCFYTDSILVVEKDNPEVEITINDSAQCDNHQIFRFELIKKGNSDSLNFKEWRVNGALTSKQAMWNTNTLPLGKSQVLLNVSSIYGCQAQTSANVYVHPSPNAAIRTSDSLQCFNNHQFLLESLSSVSSGIIQDFAWEFGDGSSSILAKPIKDDYSASGKYNITLAISTDMGCSDTAYSKMEVLPNPKAEISQVDSVCHTNVTSYFENATITDGIISSYFWKFGDGQTSEDQFAKHVYEKPGEYSVTLIVSSDNGCKDSQVNKHSAVVFPNPVADFDFSPTFIDLPEAKVSLISQSLLSTKYLWTSDDIDLNSADKDILVEFKEEGNFQIQLLVENEFGCKDSVVKGLTVHPAFDILIPNAFSPNDDGHNDFFLPFMKGASEYNIEIYDRWGQKHYEGNGISNQWYGQTQDGTELPMGVYLYIIRVKSINSKEFVYSGTVSLLR